MKHTASKRFWECFEALPAEIQALARRNYELLRSDPSHPSLQFKAVANGKLQSVRVGLYYRALGVPVTGGVHWFWISGSAPMLNTTSSLANLSLQRTAPAALRAASRCR